MDAERVVREFLRGELWERRDDEFSIGANQPLITAGILDSLALLKLIFFLEERFGITIDDGEVTPAHFDTIDRITNYLTTKAAAATRT